MPKLIIDTITLDVPEGTNVLEAARSIGITIPHFCWHPALGKAGACRVCAVKMLEGPVKGIQMSCMLPAQDGMVVSTTDREAVAMRRTVIEWLMINHPTTVRSVMRAANASSRTTPLPVATASGAMTA